MQAQVVISSTDRPLAWIQPLRLGGAMIAQAHSSIVLDADELRNLIDVASEIERVASATTTATPARARIMRYPITRHNADKSRPQHRQ